jgi:hypothetical protein
MTKRLATMLTAVVAAVALGWAVPVHADKVVILKGNADVPLFGMK